MVVMRRRPPSERSAMAMWSVLAPTLVPTSSTVSGANALTMW